MPRLVRLGACFDVAGFSLKKSLIFSHFYLAVCQVIADLAQNFFEKRCVKIWRECKKCLPLHSLLRTTPSGSG